MSGWWKQKQPGCKEHRSCLQRQEGQPERQSEAQQYLEGQIMAPSTPPPPYSEYSRTEESISNKKGHSTHGGTSTQDHSGWITLIMLPDPMACVHGLVSGRLTVLANIAWEAQLELEVKDLPNMMIHGIHWSELNILKEGGDFAYTQGIPLDYDRSLGWTWARRYTVKDLSDDPQWKGSLWVFSKKDRKSVV